MKTTFLKLGSQISWLSFFVAVFSCQHEDIMHRAPTVQAQTEITAHDNSQALAITQDAFNATGAALAAKGISNGRYAADGRISDGDLGEHVLDCQPSITSTMAIDRSHPNDSIVYTGSLTIDYGTGIFCKDSTEVRKGKLIDIFKLFINLKDSISYVLTESVTFQGYEKDSVKVDGVFSSKSTSDTTSTLSITDAKITYADGTFVTWSGTLTNQFMLTSSHERDQASRQVTGSISGTNRAGAAFSASITKAILYEYACSKNIPVAGTVALTVGS